MRLEAGSGIVALSAPVWVELRGLNPVSIPGVGTRRTSARYPSDLVKCRFRPAACLQAAEPGQESWNEFTDPVDVKVVAEAKVAEL